MEPIRQGVIPAAGMGRRIRSLVEDAPKPLILLDDKPILYHVIQNMMSCGVESIVIPVWYKGEVIEDYIRSLSKEIDIDLQVIRLDHLPPGIACTIYSARDFISDDFMVILGDDVTISPSLSNLAQTFRRRNAMVVEGVVEEPSLENLRSTCAVVLDQDSRIVDIEEKPTEPSSHLRGCGIYVFSYQIFNLIERTPVSDVRNEREITDSIGLATTLGGAYGEIIDGWNFNINTVEDLETARKYIMSMREGRTDGQ
jgi:glucose-1-phosphate thymidylyltransferase